MIREYMECSKGIALQIMNAGVNRVVKPVGSAVLKFGVIEPLFAIMDPLFFILQTGVQLVGGIRKISAKNPPSLAQNPPSLAQNPLLLPEVTIHVLSYLPLEEQVQARTVCKVWGSTWNTLHVDDISTAHAHPFYFIMREAHKVYDFIRKKNYIRRCFQAAHPAIKKAIKEVVLKAGLTEALKAGLIYSGMYFVCGKISQNYTCRINEINAYSPGVLQMMLEKFNASPYCEHSDDLPISCRPRLPSEMLKTTADLVQSLLGEARGIKILGLGAVIIVGSTCAFPYVKRAIEKACAFPYVKKFEKIMANANLDFKRITLNEEIKNKYTFIYKVGLFPSLAI